MISPKEKIVGIVDYAHTPDALENVLSTIRKLRKSDERIITVVGCGGDRDKTKRPVMGEVACKLSDQVVFTSDNPEIRRRRNNFKGHGSRTQHRSQEKIYFDY